MSFQQNPLIPTWICDKGRERKRKCKEKVKDISRFLSERLIERRRSGEGVAPYIAHSSSVLLP